MMASNGYLLRTNEHEEAVRSLEWATVQACLISSDPYNWKWVLISLHNAVQGFMVLALWNGNGLLSFPNRIAKKWLEAHENRSEYPPDKLDNFLNLYKKVKENDNFHMVGCGPFHGKPSCDNSMKLLNEFRNYFTHFTPKGWSLELAGLPQICSDALDIVEFFGWNSTAILWHDKEYAGRVRRAVECLRHSMVNLEAAYVAAGFGDSPLNSLQSPTEACTESRPEQGS